MILLLLALQETSAGAKPPVLLNIPFDLAKTSPSPERPGDIVVTGRRPSQRLPLLPDVHEELIPKAQTGFLGGTARIAVEPHSLPGGVTSNRIMLKWGLKF